MLKTLVLATLSLNTLVFKWSCSRIMQLYNIKTSEWVKVSKNISALIRNDANKSLGIET